MSGKRVRTILFFDDFPLDEYRNIRRRFMRPTPVEEGLFQDDTTLSATSRCSVEYSPDSKRYRMWYRLHCPPEPVRPARGRDYVAVLALAESADGIHWRAAHLKEKVDPFTERYPQVVFSGRFRADETHVYRDEYESDPGRRYKMAYMDWDLETGESLPDLAFSPDGIHWEMGGIRWHPGHSDCPNTLLHNPITGRYQVMCRKDVPDRRIAITESEDLQEWTPPRVVIHPDPLDPPCVQLYGMVTFYYEGIFIGFLQLLHADMSERRGAKMAGPRGGEGELAYSYDGLAWNRTHRLFMEAPPLGEYKPISNQLLVDPENRLRIYSWGSRQEHHLPHPDRTTAVQLHTLRKDGFVCLESMGTSGYVRTKMLILDGPELTFNIKAPLGTVSIQVSDGQCQPIAGYTFDDFDPWAGDDVALKPQWQGERDLSALVGRRVQFEIRMEQAQLYALRGQIRPGHSRVGLEWY